MRRQPDEVRGVEEQVAPPQPAAESEALALARPRQALQAQAVVARSYGLATSRGGAFDHYDDTRSQVYGGVAGETARTDQAIAATDAIPITMLRAG